MLECNFTHIPNGKRENQNVCYGRRWRYGGMKSTSQVTYGNRAHSTHEEKNLFKDKLSKPNEMGWPSRGGKWHVIRMFIYSLQCVWTAMMMGDVEEEETISELQPQYKCNGNGCDLVVTTGLTHANALLAFKTKAQFVFLRFFFCLFAMTWRV